VTGIPHGAAVGLLAGLVLTATAPAVAQRGKARVSRLQDPASERRIATDDSDAQADDLQDRDEARFLEPLEEAPYLRERPDSLGVAVRERHDAQIEGMLAEREKLVRVRRRQAIELLERFVAREPEAAPEMPDALLRLAELRWEVARADHLEAFGKWQELPEKRRGAPPRPDYRVALRLYDRILSKHRGFDRYDLALYMKAYALVELGESQAALALYRRILREHPDSRFVPDAHFAWAEAAFSGGQDYAAALGSYEKVLEHPDSELYDISLFKSAWCMWRLGRSKQAAKRFRQVLDLDRQRGRMTATRRRRLAELKEEALDYLIQVFVEDESNTAKDLFAFLREIGGEDYAYDVLGRLSETYMGQARYDRAIEAYELLLEMDPTVPEAPRYQEEIAQAHVQMGDAEGTLRSLQVLASRYAPGRTWASQQADPQVVDGARERAERAVRRQALRYHEIGQRAGEKDALETAAKLYHVYLRHFGEADAAYEIQFYQAEILFHRLRRWPEAGDAYLAAARINPEGDFTRDALYNAIGAYERVREGDIRKCVQARKTSGDEQHPACDETDNDRKFSEAIALYVELFPDDPDLPEILFRQGRLYYDRRIYDPAVQLFGQLLARFPKSDYAAPAGELILDSFNRAKDYQNIEQWARRLKEAPAFASDAKQKRLDGLILQAMFKIGEQLSEREEHAEAAEAYFRAAEEFPDDPRARKAYFNAGLMGQRAGNLAAAARAYDRLVERYPGSPEGAKGAWTAAQMYESIAQFSDAARYYEAYGEKFSRQDRAADALYNAVLLRVTAGENGAAVESGRRFVKRYPGHAATDDVYFFIGRAHEAAGRWSDAARTYQQYIRRGKSPDRQVEAQTRLALVLLEAGQARAAERALDGAIKLARRHASRLQSGLYYAAQARHMQGDRVLAQYEAISIAGSVEGLRGRLQRKSELLQKAALIYADVIQFGVAEWSTASLFQIGRSYETFAEALRDAPIPEGLTSEERQSYQDQLMMFVIPMEERALEAYEGGYGKALEMRIFNSWTGKLREALTRLNDIQYPPFREKGGDTVRGAPLPVPEPLDGLRRDATGGGR
jgi:cellulose synthase operon protein C